MKFKDFVEELVKELTKKFGENSVTVTSATFLDKKEKAIKIVSGEHEAICSLVPLFYLHTKGHAPFSQIISMMEDALNKMESSHKIDTSKILYKLVNQEKNRDFLSRAPHVPFYDMAITFVCQMDSDMKNRKYLVITNDVMKENHLAIEDLINKAHDNTFDLYPCQAQLIAAQLIEQHYFDPNSSLEDFMHLALTAFKDRGNVPIYITRCSDYRYGSSVILNPKYLESLSNRFGQSLILIPNTDRDFILIPYIEGTNKNEIMHDYSYIINDDNNTVLSHNIYFYDRNVKQLSILE